MKIFKKLAIKPGLSVFAVLLVLATFLPQVILAQADSSSGSTDSTSSSSGSDALDVDEFNRNLTGIDQSPDGGDNCGGVNVAFSVGCRDDFSNPILAYLVALLRFLSYGVGIVVILMIVIGGIQYAAAGDNAQSVSAAKKRIVNAFTALLLYIFAFAILNYVVPGGLIG